MTKPTLFALAAAALLAGCASMAPQLPAPDAALPAAWQEAGAAPLKADAGADTRDVMQIGWREFFTDPKLAQLIAAALDNNRNLRVAVLNIERARALYQVQRADQLPAVAASARDTRGTPPLVSPSYSAGVNVAYELDLFGRVRSLSDSALEQYFAQEEARRSTQLSLVAQVAGAYLSLAADMEAQRVAQATLEAQQASYDLIVKRHQLGAVSALDLSQARTTVESARADVARYAGQVATDRNALRLLVGGPVDPALLPSGVDLTRAGLAALPALPAQLPSEVLLRRPDVLQAEHLLRAANASIGAARAAFFPSISLTGSIGSASTELSDLFGAGTRVWSFVPQITLPIFQGGRLNANLGAAQAGRDIALAQYEQAIQSGFREVADALVLSGTLAERKRAQQDLTDAADQAHQLSKARFDSGRDSYLVLLDAQRSFYAAQQGLISAQLAEQLNRVTLYKALGGGWQERSS